MMMPSQRKLALIILVVLALLSSACVRTAPFSERAYYQAISLKVESLQLLDHSSEPYNNHLPEINQLKTHLRIAYEYAANRPDNEYSTKQWAVMIDTSRNLMGGFFIFWKTKQTLSDAFIENYKQQVGQAFNEIISLEQGKIRRKE